MFFDKSTTVISGGIAVIMGFLLLFFPSFCGAAFSVLVGITILIMGISALVTWWNVFRNTGAGGSVMLFGVFAVIIALVCMFFPVAFAESVSWIIALCMCVTSIAQIITSLSTQMPGSMRIFAITTGALALVFGVLALACPWLIMQFIGVSMLIEGISQIALMVMSKPIDVEPLD